MTKLFGTIAFVALLLLAGCRKERIEARCEQLRNGIASDDKVAVRTAITTAIASLSSQTYTSENLDKLVQAISSDCSVSATLLCFDCIQTLPSQSEIKISFTAGTASSFMSYKIIDISYTTDNRMVFYNMHN